MNAQTNVFLQELTTDEQVADGTALVAMLRAGGQWPERKMSDDEVTLAFALQEWRTCRRLGTTDHNARVVAICNTARRFGLARATVRPLLEAALTARANCEVL